MLYSTVIVAALAAVSVNAMPGVQFTPLVRVTKSYLTALHQDKLSIAYAERDPCNLALIGGNAGAVDPNNMINYFDMGPSSIWCSPWRTPTCQGNGAGDVGPHNIVFKRQTGDELHALSYLPRPQIDADVASGAGTRNGNIGDYEIAYSYTYTGNDATDSWKTIASGSWADNGDEKLVNFDTCVPKDAQFVRLKAKTEAGGRGNWACAWKVKLYKQVNA